MATIGDEFDIKNNELSFDITLEDVPFNSMRME